MSRSKSLHEAKMPVPSNSQLDPTRAFTMPVAIVPDWNDDANPLVESGPCGSNATRCAGEPRKPSMARHRYSCKGANCAG